jgi:MFS transporter, DHA2 family, multidrug resistance protein
MAVPAIGNIRGTDGLPAVSDSRGGANIWAIAIVVTLGAFMEVLDTTIVNVALPHIAGSLAVSNDESTWALTTYLVANGIVLTISGNLSVRMGRKKYFLLSVAGFTVTSFLCGVSTNFIELLIFRALQGFFGGGLQPTQQAIILDTFPPEKRQQAFSLTAIATIIAPVLGPVVGGYITDQYEWHWIFLINVPIGVATFFGVLHLVEESPEARREARRLPPFDYWGVIFITMALGCLEIATDRGEDLDWLGSNTIRALYGVSACGFLVGIVYLLYARHPVVNLRVFRDRNFALGSVAIGLMGFVLYAGAVLIPQFAQTQLAYTATWAGLALAPGAIVLIMLIPVAGRLMGVMPVNYVVASGGLALGAALFYSQNLIPQLDFFHLAFFRALQTAALALLFVPISTAAYVTLPKKEQGDGAALFTMARNVLGGIGISVSTALVTNHQQIHQQYLIEHLTPVNQPYAVLLQSVQTELTSLGQSMDAARQMAPGVVFQTLQGQNAVLAYNDVFLITGCLALLLVPVGLCMSTVKAKARSGE